MSEGLMSECSAKKASGPLSEYTFAKVLVRESFSKFVRSNRHISGLVDRFLYFREVESFRRMKQYEKIAMIGSGNVAWHLAPALEDSGHKITEVYSRQKDKAEQLARRLYQSEAQNHLDFSTSKADLVIIAVSDDAIASVSEQIKVRAKTLVVHTSGGQPLEVLANASTEHIGVLYPLQTFSRHREVSFRDIPICLEANDSGVLHRLIKLARSLSKQVKLINSKERALLHVSAVFANNFTNHLLQMAEQLMHDHQLDFSLLYPLIQETIVKALETGPTQAQTGPALRNDTKTINRHLHQLNKYDASYAEVYQLITQHIQGSSSSGSEHHE